MPRDVRPVHHPDKRHVEMPYAPALLVRRGSLLFLSGLTAAPVYHSHPHREEEFDLPPHMREQAVLLMENLKTMQPAAASVVLRFSIRSIACSRIRGGRSNSSSRCGWL